MSPHRNGRHSSASQTRFVHSESYHPGGSQSVHHSRANSRQQQRHHHRHHHHHHRKDHEGGISFITEPASESRRPKSRLDIEDSLRIFNEQDLVAMANEQEKAFCKRTQHQPNCVHKKQKQQKKNISGIDEILVDVLEAPEGFGNVEKVHKKTNTPKIPSMIILPGPIPDPHLGGLSTRFTNYLPGQGDHALFSPPSSTSGTDSSLRIRKTGNSQCTERKWFISVSLAMIFTLVIASAGIYFGYQFLKNHMPLDENVFKGEFVVTQGDFIPVATDSSGLSYVQSEKSKFYQLKLDQIFQSSNLSNSYLFNEILLLEGLEDQRSLKVHFNIHMSLKDQNVTEEDVSQILKYHIISRNSNNSFLAEIDIDPRSLLIKERTQELPPPGHRESSTIRFDYDVEDHEENLVKDSSSNILVEKCVPFDIEFCKELPYNYTIYPNGFGHRNQYEAQSFLEPIKNIINSKCHTLVYEFLCQILQPVCYLDKIVLPCREFCNEFLEQCVSEMEGFENLKKLIHCDNYLTESDGPGACISKPGCVAELRNSGKNSVICDGVVDCPDFSDELYCPYCPEHHFHCGVSKTCIAKEKMCDGFLDCDNGADERGCLSLAPHVDFASYVHQYFKSGFLIYQNSGNVAKVCADNLKKPINKSMLSQMGQSMCSILEYQTLIDINVVTDDIDLPKRKTNYVDMVRPMDQSFTTSPCDKRNVVNITCGDLECGRTPAHVKMESKIKLGMRSDMALHGDWPWFVALYKNGLHVCDGVLVDELWILTTESCFQGQGKAQWTARFATVRLQSRTPWEQKRTIIGMVKSQVEGNSVVLLKMDEALLFSDFARPICIPKEDNFVTKGSTCITLGWTQDTEELTEVSIMPTDNNICEEISEVSPNTLCTEEKTAPGIPCSGEEFAGAPLMCQRNNNQWFLVGILAWRKGCSTVGQRPRLYDRVAITSDWAEKVMLKLNEDNRLPRRY